MKLIDLETDKLLMDFVKWNADQDKDFIRILQECQAEQDTFLNPMFEQLAAETQAYFDSMDMNLEEFLGSISDMPVDIVSDGGIKK